MCPIHEEKRMAVSLDQVDLQLIRYLQDNPRAPYSTIARLIGVSETTVKRRVDDLIANRVIQPAMIPNIYRLGYRTRARIGLKVEFDHMMDIAEELRKLPETTGVEITVGRFHITCFVVLQSLDALTRFLIERIAPMDGVKDVEIMVVPRVLKVFADWRVPDDLMLDGDDITSEDTILTNAPWLEPVTDSGE
jgi:Lrp/AsnC family transcriptional regulator, regulator for asnA, asnC and gidA